MPADLCIYIEEVQILLCAAVTISDISDMKDIVVAVTEAARKLPGSATGFIGMSHA